MAPTARRLALAMALATLLPAALAQAPLPLAYFGLEMTYAPPAVPPDGSAVVVFDALRACPLRVQAYPAQDAFLRVDGPWQAEAPAAVRFAEQVCAGQPQQRVQVSVVVTPPDARGVAERFDLVLTPGEAAGAGGEPVAHPFIVETAPEPPRSTLLVRPAEPQAEAPSGSPLLPLVAVAGAFAVAVAWSRRRRR